MSLVVQKYGGTSVGNIEKIINVAKRGIAYKKKGHNIIIVVSAMAGKTDELLNMAYQINKHPDKRELDMLVSTGEQISISLLAMAIKNLGHDAISMTGGQVGIITDTAHTKARIESIDTKILKKNLKQGKIIIIAGFQGVDLSGNITTLGRGGSDTTAVAIAAATKADVCEIYTDVDGVYTADPRLVPNAKKLNTISFSEMLELASTGAKVLHSRSVIFAKRYNVKLEVKSSFNKSLTTKGTFVIKENKDMEKVLVTGVASKIDEARITIKNLPDKPGIAAKLFTALADNNINVNLIVQSSSQKNKNNISFTVPKTELKEATEITKTIANSLKTKTVTIDENIGIISIVGIGMKVNSGIAAKMFSLLAKENINLQMISTSEIKISAVIQKNSIKKAVQVLHKGFNLDKLKR